MSWSPVTPQSSAPQDVVICVQPEPQVAKQGGCKTCCWVSIVVGLVALLFVVFLLSDDSNKSTTGGHFHVSQDSSSSSEAQGQHVPVVVPTKPHPLKTELTALLSKAMGAVGRAAKAYKYNRAKHAKRFSQEQYYQKCTNAKKYQEFEKELFKLRQAIEWGDPRFFTPAEAPGLKRTLTKLISNANALADEKEEYEKKYYS
jgi:hypothetical protein